MKTAKVLTDSTGCNPLYVLSNTDVVNALVLVANTAQSFTVPAKARMYYLSCDTPGVTVWVKRNGTAVIPTSNITDGTSPLINPAGRSCAPGDTLSCICASACIVTAEFYN